MNILNPLSLLLAQVTADTSHFPVTAVSVVIVGFIAAASIGSVAWFSSEKVVGWKDNSGGTQQTSQGENQPANYDRKITSAETSARMAREGDSFKNLPKSDSNGLDTTGGYSVSREGLINNYPVEPEMYINEPGDLREKQEQEKAERIEELKERAQNGGKRSAEEKSTQN